MSKQKKGVQVPHLGLFKREVRPPGGLKLFRYRGFARGICFFVFIPFFAGLQARSSEGISLKAAQQAQRYSISHGGTSLLIQQAGFVLLEKYDNGGSASQRGVAFSMTKSLCSLMAMAADAEGVLSLNEPVSDTILEWRKDPLKRQITVRDLLNQTSGLATGYNALYSNSVRDKGRVAIQVPAITQPGRTFLYGPAHWEVFEEFLKRKLKSRGLTPLAYLRRKVLIVCAGNVSNWRMDRCGNPYFSTGALLTARQLAKVGDLILNAGHWSIFQLVAKDELLALRTGTTANPMYSMGFWLNRGAQAADTEEVAIEQRIGGGYSASSWASACISKSAPPDLIAMVGSRGQRLYIVPSRRLVIVRQGISNNFRDGEFLRLLFKS